MVQTFTALPQGHKNKNIDKYFIPVIDKVKQKEETEVGLNGLMLTETPPDEVEQTNMPRDRNHSSGLTPASRGLVAEGPVQSISLPGPCSSGEPGGNG